MINLLSRYYQELASFPKRVWYMTAGAKWASRVPNKEDVRRREGYARRMAGIPTGVQIVHITEVA